MAADAARGDHLVVFHASPGSPAQLEAKREWCHRPHLDFVFATPVRHEEALSVVAELVLAIDGFEADKAIHRSERERRRVFQLWRNILQLKTDAQRKAQAPVQFRSHEIDGERVLFDLVSAPVGVDSGESRVVEANGRRILQGEIESIADTRLTLYVSWGDVGALPRTGELRLDTSGGFMRR